MKNLLPKGNTLPETTYHARKVVCPLELEAQKIHACLNDRILHRGEEYENLGTTLELLQWKASNGLSDKGFEELLKLIKNSLPEDNTLPATTYEAKKLFVLYD